MSSKWLCMFHAKRFMWMLPTAPDSKRTVRSAMSSVSISRLEIRSTTALSSTISPHSQRM